MREGERLDATTRSYFTFLSANSYVRYDNDASDHWRTLLPAGYDDASVHVAAVHDDDHHVHIPSHNAHHHVDADDSTDDEEGGRQEGLEY